MMTIFAFRLDWSGRSTNLRIKFTVKCAVVFGTSRRSTYAQFNMRAATFLLGGGLLILRQNPCSGQNFESCAIYVLMFQAIVTIFL